VLAGTAAACFAIGIGAARLLSGSGGPEASVAIPCDPPCPEGHECLQGICVAPPASMPVVAAESAPSTAAPAAPSEGDLLASVGMQRVVKCEGPLAPDATCDHKAFPKMEYAMYGAAKRFTKCYVEARKAAPDLAGFIKVRMKIDFPAAKAEVYPDKTSNIDDPVMRRCVLDVARGVVDFSWPHLYERVSTSYQISFGLRPK